MMVIDDAVQTNDFSRHLKAGNLITSILRGDACLEEASSDGVQIAEALAIVEEGFTSFDLAPGADHFVDSVEFILGQANRHTKLAHVAIGAGNFDGLMIHGRDFDIVLCK